MENSGIKTFRLKIGGMTCINCQKKIERGLLSLSGVKGAKVSWEKERAEVTFDERAASLQKIRSEIERLGYKVLDGKNSAKKVREGLFYLLLIAIIFFFLQKSGLMNLLAPSTP